MEIQAVCLLFFFVYCTIEKAYIDELVQQKNVTVASYCVHEKAHANKSS